MNNEAAALAHRAMRNALYQAARRRWLEAMDRCFSFSVVALGAAIIVQTVVPFGVETMYIGAAVVIIGAYHLALDLSGRAREHQTLQQKYYALLARIAQETNPSPETIEFVEAQMTIIAREEPPILRAVDAKAFNDAIAALGHYDDSERLVIPAWMRPLQNVLTFEGYDFKKVSQPK
ncbi:hypothetical protein [Pseudogemmobacter sp. W21_MBD1_M6]|uniref:hypothetical protein n=1 Tax=Pseudogemmobacter sp. W21_MBD1_M6 TaxID=3240271 RepID=UPI003F977D92